LIILDTNVVSEPIRETPSAAVEAWLDRQNFEHLFLTSVSVAELLVGVEILPAGRRRDALAVKIAEVIGLFGEARLLAFDVVAAQTYAICVARARAAGSVLSVADGQIAAIATARGFSVATRDVAPFQAAGVKVINPWDLAGEPAAP
jgi:predicted nucleic acid-binding protein